EANNSVVWVSDKVWSALSADQKGWVRGAADEVNRLQPGKALELEQQSAAKLKSMGVKVVTDVDKSGFFKIAEPYLDKLSKELGPRAPKIRQLVGAIQSPGWQRQMSADALVLQRQRHLKWRALDVLERILMWLCGVTLLGFTTSVILDIVTRTIGHPWLWLQEVTSTFFIYGIFIGAAVATRRNDHLYLTAIAEALHGRARLVVEVIIRLVILAVALALV